MCVCGISQTMLKAIYEGILYEAFSIYLVPTELNVVFLVSNWWQLIANKRLLCDQENTRPAIDEPARRHPKTLKECDDIPSNDNKQAPFTCRMAGKRHIQAVSSGRSKLFS